MANKSEKFGLERLWGGLTVDSLGPVGCVCWVRVCGRVLRRDCAAPRGTSRIAAPLTFRHFEPRVILSFRIQPILPEKSKISRNGEKENRTKRPTRRFRGTPSVLRLQRRPQPPRIDRWVIWFFSEIIKRFNLSTQSYFVTKISVGK